MKFRPSPDVLEDRRLMSFGGGNIDASIPRVQTSNPGLNFTSNSFHQINATVPKVASTILSDPSSTNAQLAAYVSHLPYGNSSLLPILKADIAAFRQGGTTISTADATRVITFLYDNLLDHAPDAAALAAGVPAMQSGVTPTLVADAIVQSPEFIQAHVTAGATPAANQAQFVTALYKELLGRTPDAAGLGFWTGQLATGAQTVQQVAHAIVTSTEAATSPDAVLQYELTDSIAAIYDSLLHRAPDAAALAAGIPALRSGTTPTQVADAVAQSPEFIQANTTVGATPNANQVQFVTALYQDVLGRTPDPAGLSSWVNQLNSGASTVQQVAHAIVTSTEAATSSTSVIPQASIPVIGGATYYFGTVGPNGSIYGNFAGTGATAQLENLIQNDTLAYLGNGIGQKFNVLKSGVKYASDALLTYNGRV
jgi:hypothetical protein